MSKRLTEHERDRMSSSVHSLLERRIQMAKFPVEDDRLYEFWRTLVPDEVTKAIDVLVASDYKSMVDTDWRIGIILGDNKVTISPDESMYWSTGRDGIPVPETHPMYKPITEFITLRIRINYETMVTQKVARELIWTVGAAGQIKRAWPELASFLSPEAKDSVRSVQRASRLPVGFNMTDFNANRDLYNRVLAEAHILPSDHMNGASYEVY